MKRVDPKAFRRMSNLILTLWPIKQPSTSRASTQLLLSKTGSWQITLVSLFPSFRSQSTRSQPCLTWTRHIVSDKNFVLTLFRTNPTVNKCGVSEASKKYTCVFWDYTSSMWNSSGCHYSNYKGLHSCECNHLTNFAVLMVCILFSLGIKIRIVYF